MSKSLLTTIVKTLKILTWVCIFGCIFCLYASFRQSLEADQKMYNYYALAVMAVGWGCNFLAKLLPKHFAQNEDEQ